MIAIEESTLQTMLFKAAQMGADHAISALVSYNITEAAQQIGVTPKTLAKRMLEGKIHSVDGRIAGSEIRKYLSNA